MKDNVCQNHHEMRRERVPQSKQVYKGLHDCMPSAWDEPSNTVPTTNGCRQTLGMVHSWKKVGQKGQLTRLMACDVEDWPGTVIAQGKNIHTHKHPNWAVHPTTRDGYLLPAPLVLSIAVNAHFPIRSKRVPYCCIHYSH